MIKITELKETKYKTVREKDAFGNRIPRKVAYQGNRTVNVVSGGRRFAHFFVDSIIYYVIYYFFLTIYNYVFVQSNDPINAIIGAYTISVFFMFLSPLYYIVFEHFFQRTPGKFLTKTIVVDLYGNKPDMGTNILRNIIRMVPFEIFSCLSDRGWHDRWSDTFVIRNEEYEKIKQLQEEQSSGVTG